MKRDHRDYLLDIHESIRKIEKFTKSYSFSLNDRAIALKRNILI